MRFTYSQQHIEFLRKTYRKMGKADTTAAFNAEFGLSLTLSQISAALKNHKITCGRKKGELLKGQLRVHTQAQFEWIKKEYRSKSLAELTAAYNQKFNATKTQKQIRATLRNHRINSGRTGQFVKNQQPWNTGTKGVMKPNSGNFKKGQRAHNWRPLGSERINAEGYTEVKVAEADPHTGAPTRFKLKHQLVYEKHFGPIPKGHNVRFKDGDRTNCDPSNLELFSRAEHAMLNKMQYTTAPQEIKPTLKLIAKLHHTRNQRLKVA